MCKPRSTHFDMETNFFGQYCCENWLYWKKMEPISSYIIVDDEYKYNPYIERLSMNWIKKISPIQEKCT